MHGGLAVAAPPDTTPDPARLGQAADAFDAGARAFDAGDFEAAASRFESAYALVPSDRTLELAMLARDRGGQPSRAATLAALLLEVSQDAALRKRAGDLIARHEAGLFELVILCDRPCVPASRERSLLGAPAERWRLFIAPGRTSIGASFDGGGSSPWRDVGGEAGEREEIVLGPDEESAAEPPLAIAPQVTLPIAAAPPEAESSGWPSAIFWTSAAVSAGLVGVTIWSGLDAQSSPGPDVVRDECAGKTTTCPAYQEGRESQLRTNILLGATGASVALTAVIGVFLTDWRSSTHGLTLDVAPGHAVATWGGSL